MLLASIPSYSHPQYLAILMKASSSGEEALKVIFGFFSIVLIYSTSSITLWHIENDKSISKISEFEAKLSFYFLTKSKNL